MAQDELETQVSALVDKRLAERETERAKLAQRVPLTITPAVLNEWARNIERFIRELAPGTFASAAPAV